MTWLAADAAAPARATSSAEGEGIAMDAEKLIEEAGRLCDAADPGPWELDDNVVMSGEEAVAECYLFGDARFIARARTLVPDLVTALRAERERAEKAEEQARQQSVWAENIAAVAEQTNAVARDCIRERDTARAELARLTTPRPIAEAPKDGAWIGAIWEDMDAEDCQRYGPIAVVKWRGTGWEDSDGDGYEPPSHFLPLQVLP